MTPSLRSRLVVAAAEVFRAADHRDPYATSYAGLALDAMLSCLTENADEWAEETHVPTLVGGDALALLAVLRNPE